MGDYIKQLAQTTGGNIVTGALGGIMGQIFGGMNDKRQLEQQQKLQELQIKGEKEMADYNMNNQYQMWLKTNYPGQIEQLNKAGLNPALLYGGGGGGGTTVGSPNGNVTGATATQSGGGEIMGMTQAMLQNQLIKAQTENIEADTANKEADTQVKSVTKPNIEADTEVKVSQNALNILEQVIKEYAGKEAQDQYERIKSPNRSIEAKTYMDEMEARQGLAGTIYELWRDGKLEEKAYSEIEAIAISNAKSKEEKRKVTQEIDNLEENLKGVRLDNVMKKLESDLQTKTGIDKNSPTYLKILGRLFVTLFNK